MDEIKKIGDVKTLGLQFSKDNKKQKEERGGIAKPSSGNKLPSGPISSGSSGNKLPAPAPAPAPVAPVAPAISGAKGIAKPVIQKEVGLIDDIAGIQGKPNPGEGGRLIGLQENEHELEIEQAMLEAQLMAEVRLLKTQYSTQYDFTGGLWEYFWKFNKITSRQNLTSNIEKWDDLMKGIDRTVNMAENKAHAEFKQNNREQLQRELAACDHGEPKEGPGNRLTGRYNVMIGAIMS